MQTSILEQILEEKKDISGKTGEVQVKVSSLDNSI